MRILAIISILCVFSSAVLAQAADPDAIDLSGKMDTIVREDLVNQISPIANFNIGIRNKDQWEDFCIYYSTPLRSIPKLRFGGFPLLFDSSDNPVLSQYEIHPSAFADFNGDNISDVIFEDGYSWERGIKDFPYLDTSDAQEHRFHYEGFPSLKIMSTLDYDGDGFNDLLVFAGKRDKTFLRLYSGGQDFGAHNPIFPTDSILITPNLTFLKGTAVAQFKKISPPMSFIGAFFNDSIIHNQYRIGFIRHKVSLNLDTLIWISNSDSGGIAVQNLFSMDVTGDGISDLLVSDGSNVYIFKGGDDIGTYSLNPANAFYIIKSPKQLDNTNYSSLIKFGSLMQNGGNLSGSGIPFLIVSGTIDEAGYSKGYEFIYAGGKALDSLYDGIISAECLGFVCDTLHSVDNTGRTAILVYDSRDLNDNNRNIDLLLFRDCDKIPHKTNPTMVVKTTSSNSRATLNTRSYPTIADRYTKLDITTSESANVLITVLNILGETVLKREIHCDIDLNTEYFETAQWNSGVYIFKINTKVSETQTKVIIHH